MKPDARYHLDARKEAVIAGLFVTVVVLLRSLSGMMQVGAFNDDGVYVALGKALAEGRGYLSIHLVGAPVHPKFPPVFPLILSVLWRLTGSVEGVHRLVGLVHPLVLGATGGMLWWLGRTRFSVPRALLAVFVIAMLLFDSAIQYYTIPLSEPWFMLGWASVLVLWARAEGADAGRRTVLLCGTALMIAFTVLVRTHGIVLVPAILAGLSSRRYSLRDRVVTVAAMAAPMVAWNVYHGALIARGPNSTLPDDVTYNTWLGSGRVDTIQVVAQSVISNVQSYVEQFGTYMSGMAVVGPVLAAALLSAMALGSVAMIRRDRVVGISATGGLVVVLLWPFAQDRLLLSVLPFCGLAFAIWITPRVARLRWLPPRVATYGAAVVIALFLLKQGDIRRANIEAIATSRAPASYSPGYMLLVNSRFIAQASGWIRANTGNGDRFMIDNHPGIYLYTDRLTMPANPSESRLQASVFTKPGHYLASHILRDSLTYLIVAVDGEGIMRDIETVKRRCPAVLRWGGVSRDDPQSIMKISRDERCLSQIVADGKTLISTAR